MLHRIPMSFALCLWAFLAFAQSEMDTIAPAETIIPEVAWSDYTLSAADGALIFKAPMPDGKARLQVNGEAQEVLFEKGEARLATGADAKGQLLLLTTADEQNRLYHIARRNNGTYRVQHIPLWLSLLPPLVAIALALIFKEVIISLFTGIWVGAFIAGGMRLESLYYFVQSLLEVVQKYVVKALYDSGHLAIIVFSLLIGGMVAIISRNGGMGGIVLALSKYARSARSTQFITWLLGVAIFFDDYANTLIVGNTMRAATDRFRISREKLAYIVDSTAAPVAAIAFITTWIGAELGYIDDGIQSLEGFNAGLTPYAIFISSLKYSFYPVLTLLFMLMLIYTRRDFGPMYKAEHRARTTGKVSGKAGDDSVSSHIEELQPVKGAPLKWYNAFFPVLAVIIMTIFGLLDTGFAAIWSELSDEGLAPVSQSWGQVWGAMGPLFEGNAPSFFMKIGKVIGTADSYVALLWASLSGVILAIVLTLVGRIMSLADTIDTMSTGFKTMLPALMILTLAWSLALTTEELHTATFLTASLKNSLNPYWMPVITFVLAALISFSTGSSWSTMAILYPIAIPTTWAICQAQGVEGTELLFNVIAVVLAASVLGDHCSPISDTTILSSLASDCNHIDHVRTQLPYALTVGAVSLLAGGVSTLLGGGWGISLLLFVASGVLLFLIIMRFGKRIEESRSQPDGKEGVSI